MSDTNRSKARRRNDLVVGPQSTGLFDCCYTSPGAFCLSICLPFGSCIVQGRAVKIATNGDFGVCFGSCALASTTLCIGFAMNRKKIHDRQQASVEDCLIGLCCMPCGVTQDFHYAKSNESGNYKKLP